MVAATTHSNKLGGLTGAQKLRAGRVKDSLQREGDDRQRNGPVDDVGGRQQMRHRIERPGECHGQKVKSCPDG